MLKFFEEKKRLLFFPVKWANSVTRWLTALSSPKGTIKINNTTNPTEDKGCQIDIVPEKAAEEMKKVLDARYVVREKLIKELMDVLSACDFEIVNKKIRVATPYCVAPVWGNAFGGFRFGKPDQLDKNGQSSYVETATCPNAGA